MFTKVATYSGECQFIQRDSQFHHRVCLSERTSYCGEILVTCLSGKFCLESLTNQLETSKHALYTIHSHSRHCEAFCLHHINATPQKYASIDVSILWYYVWRHRVCHTRQNTNLLTSKDECRWIHKRHSIYKYSTQGTHNMTQHCMRSTEVAPDVCLPTSSTDCHTSFGGLSCTN